MRVCSLWHCLGKSSSSLAVLNQFATCGMDRTRTTLKQFGDLGNPFYIFKVKIYIDIFKG